MLGWGRSRAHHCDAPGWLLGVWPQAHSADPCHCYASHSLHRATACTLAPSWSEAVLVGSGSSQHASLPLWLLPAAHSFSSDCPVTLQRPPVLERTETAVNDVCGDLGEGRKWLAR